MTTKVVKLGASLLFTAALFYFIWLKIGPDLSGLSFRLDWRWAVAAGLFYALALAGKAYRFRFFLEKKISFPEMFSIAAIHSFWNNLLPFRSGELSYFYLLRKHKSVEGGEGVTSLMVSRVADALVVLLFFALAIFLLSLSQEGALNFGAGLPLAFILLIAAIYFVLVFFNERLLWLFDRARLPFSFLRGFFGDKAREAIYAFSRLRSLRTSGFFFVYSLAIWFADLLFVWAALAASGLLLPPAQAFFIAAFPVAASLLPLQNPAGIGTFEGVVTGGLLFLKIDGAQALKGSILLHAELLFVSFVFFNLARLNKLPRSYRLIFSKREGRKNGPGPKTHTELYASLVSPEEDFRNSNLAALIMSYAQGQTLLDIGCGNGLLLSRAAKEFCAVGIEPDDKLVELARRRNPRLNIIPTSLEQFLTQERFDTVVVSDVLECVPDDTLFLKKAVALLKPGGRLIITAPAHPRLFGSRDRLLGYLRRYRRKNLTEQVRQLGLRVLLTRYWNLLGFIPYLLLYRVFRRTSHYESLRGNDPRNKIAHFLSRLLYFWFGLVENKVNFGFGLSLIIVAEKPK